MQRMNEQLMKFLTLKSKSFYKKKSKNHIGGRILPLPPFKRMINICLHFKAQMAVIEFTSVIYLHLSFYVCKAF